VGNHGWGNWREMEIGGLVSDVGNVGNAGKFWGYQSTSR